jgi:PelA/Pel-15E family pectate lyase
VAFAAPGKHEALDAMTRASDYMMNAVAYRGGFVDKYTEDLSERWGEVPARATMIWVQDPGTVTVGRAFLEAYQATGEAIFLQHSEATANALVWGQLPCGGWHYFVDFDPAGTQQWYHDVLSKAWGWEEFYHWSGNATYDDDTTIGAAGFLLDLYKTTQDPRYRVPLEKALSFVLESQYPLGGWPQRYPLNYEHVEEGRPDYTSYYTFNDGVIAGNIDFLLRAHNEFGDERYRDAALRGMYFTMISQLGTPQAGWAQQYNMDLQPAQARSFEPAAVEPSQTAENIRALMRYYTITGDRRFLRGIPDAIAWLDEARLPKGHSDTHTHAQFVEVGTGKPLYAHREGTDREHGRYWIDYVPKDFPGHYGMQTTIDVEALRKEYARVDALSPVEAMAEYQAAKSAKSPAPNVSVETVEKIVAAMDERGAWIEDLEVVDYTDWKFKPRRKFRGISTRTFVQNLRMLSSYVANSVDEQ